MDMQTGKSVALVTGGARRVGRAIVERLHAAGFEVAFTYLSSRGEAESLAKITGGLAIQADLSQGQSAIDAIFQQFSGRFDRLSVLVNNASEFLPSDLKNTTEQMIQRMTTIHVTAPLLLCQRFEPMLRASRGHVVNMIDHLAEKPWPDYMAYSASKAALSNLTISLARELAPQVTVNGIAPGVVKWPENFPTEQREQYLKRVPLGRAGTPEDVANLVHFLATAGGYITGQIIRLDGGRSIT